MISAEQLDARSCVLLRLGERRFALTAEQIAELVAPRRVFRFAHRTPELDGVILRRGRVVPVCDVGFIWWPRAAAAKPSIGSRSPSVANVN